MKIVFYIYAFSLAFFGRTQDFARSLQWIALAEQAYKDGNFLESSNCYDSAFVASMGMVNNHDIYNAACSNALGNRVEIAFILLESIVYTPIDPYTSYEHLSEDKDLEVLHTHSKWLQLVEKAKSNQINQYAVLDSVLIEELRIIYDDDQLLRLEEDELIKTYGKSSNEVNALWSAIAVKDSINVLKVTKILDEKGWLGPNIVGRDGNRALFLVIQHASLEIQIKYLPMIKVAVQNGSAQASDLAMLEDRIAIRKGEKQIYGSQIGFNKETNTYYVEPVIDPTNIDQRRLKVGLIPIAEYVAMWNITWDPLAGNN